MRKIAAALTLIVVVTLPIAAQPASAVTFTGPAQLVARAYHWQAESRIPLGNETVALSATQLCPTIGYDPAGCSSPGMSYTRTKQMFYFEMGHQFDWTYLTDADRAWLATQWHASRAAWWDTEAELEQNDEDGLQGVFPELFELCADGDPTTHAQFHLWTVAPWVKTGRFNTCSFVRYVESHTQLGS